MIDIVDWARPSVKSCAEHINGKTVGRQDHDAIDSDKTARHQPQRREPPTIFSRPRDQRLYELVDRLDCALLHALIRDTVEKWSPSVLHNLITTMGCDLKPRRCVRLADTPGNRHARRRRQARICRRAVFQVPRRRKSQASASPDCALARAIIVAASAPAIHPSS